MFERYYLQKGQTIFVTQSDDQIFQHLQHQKVRCFEQIHDFVNHRDLFVVGSATYIQPQSKLQPGQNRQELVNQAIEENTLTFLDGDRNVFSLTRAGQHY